MEATLYYDEQLLGLGDNLLESIEKLLDLISNNPYSFQEILPPYRRAVENKFKYNIIYRIEDDVLTVIVISIQHGSRHQSKWEDRTS